MDSRMYGYARVSSTDQNLDRQISALLSYGVEQQLITCDKQSGKDFNRIGYQYLIQNLLREGDILVVKELDRLGRNYEELKSEWHRLQSKGIEIVVIDRPCLNTANKSDLEKTLINNILLEILSYSAEAERMKIKQRQREGIARAKENGVHCGRARKSFPPNWTEVYARWEANQITAAVAMQQLDLKRTTFYALVKKYKDMQEV